MALASICRPSRYHFSIRPNRDRDRFLGRYPVIESTDAGEVVHDGPDLFYYALNASLTNPYGRSIIKAVPL